MKKIRVNRSHLFSCRQGQKEVIPEANHWKPMPFGSGWRRIVQKWLGWTLFGIFRSICNALRAVRVGRSCLWTEKVPYSKISLWYSMQSRSTVSRVRPVEWFRWSWRCLPIRMKYYWIWTDSYEMALRIKILICWSNVDSVEHIHQAPQTTLERSAYGQIEWVNADDSKGICIQEHGIDHECCNIDR